MLDCYIGAKYQLEEKHVKLAGVSCLAIAESLCEIYYTPIEYLISFSAELYVKKQIEDMSYSICHCLEYNLYTPVLMNYFDGEVPPVLNLFLMYTVLYHPKLLDEPLKAVTMCLQLSRNFFAQVTDSNQHKHNELKKIFDKLCESFSERNIQDSSEDDRPRKRPRNDCGSSEFNLLFSNWIVKTRYTIDFEIIEQLHLHKSLTWKSEKHAKELDDLYDKLNNMTKREVFDQLSAAHT